MEIDVSKLTDIYVDAVPSSAVYFNNTHVWSSTNPKSKELASKSIDSGERNFYRYEYSPKIQYHAYNAVCYTDVNTQLLLFLHYVDGSTEYIEVIDKNIVLATLSATKEVEKIVCLITTGESKPAIKFKLYGVENND